MRLARGLHMVFASAVVVACLTTGCTTQRARVEQSRQKSVAQVEQIDAARDRIARMETDRQALRNQIADLEGQLKKREEVHELMQARLSGAKREGERLQTELTSAVLSGTTDATKNAPSPETETFRLPAGLVGRLNVLANEHPKAAFDRRLKVVRFPGAFLFGNGDTLKPEGQAALQSFAKAIKQPDSQNLKLLVSVQVDPENKLSRELETQYPTDWHLAAHQAIAVHQYLERCGLAAPNVGVTVQQYPLGSQANDRPRVEIYLNEPDVNVE